MLFEQGKIGSMTLRNRFVRSATRELLASDDDHLTDRYIRVYTRLARGGVGLIIPGSYYVKSIGRPSPRIIVLDRDEVVEDLHRLVQAVHDHGAMIVGQLNHAGRQSDPKVTGMAPIGPSRVRDKRSLIKPRAMNEREIEDTIAAFGSAARRLKDAGFDGVQIHAAHGYLVNQFLSGYTNRRRDQWGGRLENRMRFLTEIYRLIRSKVGTDYPVLVKINAEDFVPGGFTLEEAVMVCKELDDMGIDAIEVSGGIGENGFITIRGDVPMDLIMRNRSLLARMMVRIKEKSFRKEAFFQEAYFLPQAAAVKAKVKAPVIAVGGMRHRSVMDEALRSGQADFISMCRPFIRQPNLVNLMAGGREDPITCRNCNRCSIEVLAHQHPMRCYNADAAH